MSEVCFAVGSGLNAEVVLISVIYFVACAVEGDSISSATQEHMPVQHETAASGKATIACSGWPCSPQRPSCCSQTCWTD